MKNGKVMGYAQSHTGASIRILIAAHVETLKDVLLVFVADSSTIISYDNLHHGLIVGINFVSEIYGHTYPSTFGSKLHGVGEQVVDNLPNLVGIESHYQRRNVGAELDVDVLASESLEVCHNIANVHHEVARDEIQLFLVLLNFSEIENLPHHLEQPFGVSEDEFQGLVLLRVILFLYQSLKRRDNEH